MGSSIVFLGDTPVELKADSEVVIPPKTVHVTLNPAEDTYFLSKSKLSTRTVKGSRSAK